MALGMIWQLVRSSPSPRSSPEAEQIGLHQRSRHRYLARAGGRCPTRAAVQGNVVADEQARTRVES